MTSALIAHDITNTVVSANADTFHPFSSAGVVQNTPAPSGAKAFPVETAIRTQHGVAIVRSRWTGAAWQHRFPSHGKPGQHHIVTAMSCDCEGFTHRGRCYHVAAAQDIEEQLHRDIYDALRAMRWCNSSEEIVFGWRSLARIGISEDQAREVLA
jgi:hypothetical protein